MVPGMLDFGAVDIREDRALLKASVLAEAMSLVFVDFCGRGSPYRFGFLDDMFAGVPE